MRKSLNLALFVSVFFAAMLVSCKKNEKPTLLPTKLTLEDAKAYHQRLQSKYGNFDVIEISGRTEKNYKSVDFSKAYIGENATSFFVEAPVAYTKREVMLSAAPGISEPILKKMFSNSFDRLVIYKDKTSGMVSEKIVTIIPSVDYINNGNKDLHKNHFLSIAKDFSGYVSNRSWNGKYLSTQSYNLGSETAKVTDVNCEYETFYRFFIHCEDVDENGHGVNCDMFLIVSWQGLVCTMVPPTFHNHQTPLPGANDTYWTGWPDPQVTPGNPCPPYGGRVNESPIMFAGVNASSFSVTLYEACFCQGYSWIILEEAATGTEYSFPINNQNWLHTECTSIWETNVQLPSNIPSGEYFVKVHLDGDVFYHQLEINGTVQKRWKHTL